MRVLAIERPADALFGVALVSVSHMWLGMSVELLVLLMAPIAVTLLVPLTLHRI